MVTRNHEDPYGPPLATADEDQPQRWRPHPQAVRHAHALLDAEPHAAQALIPLYMPGKTRNRWAPGQPVRTVAGIVLLSHNRTSNVAGFVPDHSRARDLAARIAALELRAWAAERPGFHNLAGGLGTVGWATVDRDGFVAVSEDPMSPTDLLLPPTAAASSA